MRIMFVAGASIHSERWVSFFADKGHAVTWVLLGEAPKKTYANLHVEEISRHRLRPLRPLAYVAALKKVLARIRPNVLHAHQVWIDAIVAAATGYKPLVITPWGSDVLLGPRSPLKRPLIAKALRAATLITCDGDNTADAVERLGVPRQKIKTVCFGTDVRQFTPDRSCQDIRNRLQVGGRPIVVSLRSLNPLYDVGTLVRSVPLVLEQFPEAAFVIAGGGTQRSELIQLGERLGVSHAIYFVGQVPQAELPRYLATSDVYVSTALSDSGLAASTAEAMACGLPVVVTDTGANRDWIDDGINGHIIPVKDPVILARRIADLLRDPGRRGSWGRLNRGIIVERNNYEREMLKMEALYEGLCRTPRL